MEMTIRTEIYSISIPEPCIIESHFTAPSTGMQKYILNSYSNSFTVRKIDISNIEISSAIDFKLLFSDKGIFLESSNTKTSVNSTKKTTDRHTGNIVLHLANRVSLLSWISAESDNLGF